MYAGKIVEIGTAEEIFMIQGIHIPGDCYSHSPFCQKEKNGSPTLPGMPPTLIHPPKGDAFAEETVYAMRVDYEKRSLLCFRLQILIMRLPGCWMNGRRGEGSDRRTKRWKMIFYWMCSIFRMFRRIENESKSSKRCFFSDKEGKFTVW